jgi:hypothetical protein
MDNLTLRLTINGTLVHQLNEWRLNRNGNWLKSPYFVYGEDSTPEEIEGVEESLANQDLLSTPFVIVHNKGSVGFGQSCFPAFT